MIQTALYSLFWYELDQAIRIGITDNFYFFRNVVPLKFCNGIFRREDAVKHRCRIESIYHNDLGGVSQIDTSGLEYTITLTNGAIFKVEAEETPGDVYDFHIKPKDWNFRVGLEIVN